MTQNLEINSNQINQNYEGIKKMDNFETYSSDLVEKIPHHELIEIIKKSNLST